MKCLWSKLWLLREEEETTNAQQHGLFLASSQQEPMTSCGGSIHPLLFLKHHWLAS